MKLYSNKILVLSLGFYLLGTPIIVFSKPMHNNNSSNSEPIYNGKHGNDQKKQPLISDSDSAYYFFSNKEIKEMDIKYIKIFNNSRDDTAFYKGRGFEKYDFLDGRLITELSFDQTKTNLE